MEAFSRNEQYLSNKDNAVKKKDHHYLVCLSSVTIIMLLFDTLRNCLNIAINHQYSYFAPSQSVSHDFTVDKAQKNCTNDLRMKTRHKNMQNFIDKAIDAFCFRLVKFLYFYFSMIRRSCLFQLLLPSATNNCV